MQIAVFGAGAWGTALAIAAADRHDVLLWARDAGQAAQMRKARRNARYLPDAPLPDPLRVEADAALAQQHALAGLAIVATPMAGLRETLQRLAPTTRVLWLCKGFEPRTGRLGHQIAAEVLPQAAAGVLSGPSFAQEVAAGRPTALVAASRDPQLLDVAVQALHSDQLRIYTSSDPVGVELGGAVKNVLAIATGIADGLGLGANARAALITRGLAEMTRLGVAAGALAETFSGLSGLGDLVLTATGELSRNRQVGLGLARGESLQPLLARLGHVAEGVHSAAAVVRLAGSLGVEMPLAGAVHEVLERRCTPAEAVQRLMQRDARPEN